jgi:hypothetical protein
LFRRADLDSHQRSTVGWLGTYGFLIDDVRAALDWAFAPEGDSDLGIALTIVTVPLWLLLSQMEECHRHVDRALASVRSSSAPDARRDIQLSAALGSVLVYTSMGPAARTAWTNALGLAENLHDIEYMLRSLWGLWVDSLNNGAFQEAVELARRFYRTAADSADPADLLMGDRMIGIALHFLGDQVEARQHIDRMLDRYVAPIRPLPVAAWVPGSSATRARDHGRGCAIGRPRAVSLQCPWAGSLPCGTVERGFGRRRALLAIAA